MNKLNKLLAATSPEETQAISIVEFLTVEPHEFTVIKGENQLDVDITSISADKKMLVVEANCKLNGIAIATNNPLCFIGAVILVADGTFESFFDETLQQTVSIPNLHEDAEAALEQHVLSTLESSVLGGESWVR
mgnify:CR=1 FL=1|tara:strand:- start:297 stop:698 length:402 start_codon:yes stop_codon:yes gene_type:complete